MLSSGRVRADGDAIQAPAPPLALGVVEAETASVAPRGAPNAGSFLRSRAFEVMRPTP